MDLVILAAGLGSRFGGTKQAMPIDEQGNFILHYSAYDAVRAGFDRVILVVRKEHEPLFEEAVCKRLRKFVPVEFAYQSMQDIPQGASVPPSRTKPWGTAHALYSCKDIVSSRFAVINADDFYGFDSYRVVADFLKESSYDQFVSAGFKAKNTLSEKGAVKRGIFQLDGQRAVGLVESNVERRGDKIYATPIDRDDWHQIDPDTMVSMTIFGFSKKIFKQIELDMKKFFQQDEEKLQTGELLLPNVVNEMLDTTEMYVLPTRSKWFGVTYRDELDMVKSSIQQMKEENVYPQNF